MRRKRKSYRPVRLITTTIRVLFRMKRLTMHGFMIPLDMG